MEKKSTTQLHQLHTKISTNTFFTIKQNVLDKCLEYISVSSVTNVLSYHGLVEARIADEKICHLLRELWRRRGRHDPPLLEKEDSLLGLLVELLCGGDNDLRREGAREGGSEGGRERGREGAREGGSEGGRERGREEAREVARE